MVSHRLVRGSNQEHRAPGVAIVHVFDGRADFLGTVTEVPNSTLELPRSKIHSRTLLKATDTPAQSP
jgi:hypothetical protein